MGETRTKRIPGKQFGRGYVHDWPWFFEGRSTVQVKSIEEICAWLSRCQYAPDIAVFNEHDFWQHPVTFEATRKGDCEDHALWAWRKLTELGYSAEFVRGHYFDGTDLRSRAHAAVVFEQSRARYFLDASAKGSRAKMLMPVSAARQLFCPECSVDSSFKTYGYVGRALILQRKLRDEGPLSKPIQPRASPNGGPAEPPLNSSTGVGPPSVS